MKTTQMKSLTGMMLLLLCAAISFGAPQVKKTRTFTELHNINPKATIEIDSKFGELSLLNWEENKISIEVISKVAAKNEKEAVKLLEMVDIVVDASLDYVSLTTDLEDFFNKANDHYEISVDIIIRVPTTVSMLIEHKYGSINVAKITGNFSLELKYGSLSAEEISGESVNLELSYAEAARIQKTKDIMVENQYSALNIFEARNVSIESKYGSVTLEKCTDLNGEFKGGGVFVGEVQTAVIESSMGDLEIRKLIVSAEIEQNYGSVTIREVSSGFSGLDIENSYGDVRLNFNNKAAFSFIFEGKHGSFTYPKGFLKILEHNVDSYSEYISGEIGNHNGINAKVNIESEFGSVELKM